MADEQKEEMVNELLRQTSSVDSDAAPPAPDAHVHVSRKSSGIFSSVGKGLSSSISGINRGLSDVGGGLVGSLDNVGKGLGKGIGKGFSGINRGLSDVGGGLVGSLDHVGKGLGKGFDGLGKGLANVGSVSKHMIAHATSNADGLSSLGRAQASRFTSMIGQLGQHGDSVLKVVMLQDAEEGQYVFIQHLLEEALFLKPDTMLSTVNDEGRTALHLACANGHDRVAKTLLDHMGRIGRAQAFVAAGVGHEFGGILTRMQRQEAKRRRKKRRVRAVPAPAPAAHVDGGEGGFSHEHDDKGKGDSPGGSYRDAYGPRGGDAVSCMVHRRDRFGNDALVLACRNKQQRDGAALRCVTLLLEAGAVVTINALKETAFHWAVKLGLPRIVRLMLDTKTCHVHRMAMKKNRSKRTALDIAGGKLEQLVVRALLTPFQRLHGPSGTHFMGITKLILQRSLHPSLMPFRHARACVHAANKQLRFALQTETDYLTWCERSEQRPASVPLHPDLIYGRNAVALGEDSQWRGWKDWLGTASADISSSGTDRGAVDGKDAGSGGVARIKVSSGAAAERIQRPRIQKMQSFEVGQDPDWAPGGHKELHLATQLLSKEYKQCCLFWAAYVGDVAAVRAALSATQRGDHDKTLAPANPVAPNLGHPHRSTPLHMAAKTGRREVIRLLLKHLPAVAFDIPDDTDDKGGRKETGGERGKKSALVAPAGKDTSKAATTHNVYVCEGINAVDAHGNTPLHHAAMYASVPCTFTQGLDFLRDATAAGVGSGGDTGAGRVASVETLSLLMRFGADPTIMNNASITSYAYCNLARPSLRRCLRRLSFDKHDHVDDVHDAHGLVSRLELHRVGMKTKSSYDKKKEQQKRKVGGVEAKGDACASKHNDGATMQATYQLGLFGSQSGKKKEGQQGLFKVQSSVRQVSKTVIPFSVSSSSNGSALARRTKRTLRRRFQHAPKQWGELCANRNSWRTDWVLVFTAAQQHQFKKIRHFFRRRPGILTATFMQHTTKHRFLMLQVAAGSEQKLAEYVQHDCKLISEFDRVPFDVARAHVFAPLTVSDLQCCLKAYLDLFFNVDLYVKLSVINSHFPTHDENFVNLILDRWVWPEKRLHPLECWREYLSTSRFHKFGDVQILASYFGERVALYFAFASYLTTWCLILLLPSLLATGWLLVAWYLDKEDNATATFHHSRGGFVVSLLAVTSVGWAMGLTAVWKQKQSELTTQWDMLEEDDGSHETAKIDFRGDEQISEITGRVEKQIDPEWGKHQARLRIMVSTLLIFVCAAAVFMVVFLCIEFKRATAVQVEKTGGPWWMKQIYRSLAGLMQGVGIQILNIIFSDVVGKLVEWENHRTVDEHENSLILKTFIFQFVNSYTAVLYELFVRQELINAGVTAASVVAGSDGVALGMKVFKAYRVKWAQARVLIGREVLGQEEDAEEKANLASEAKRKSKSKRGKLDIGRGIKRRVSKVVTTVGDKASGGGHGGKVTLGFSADSQGEVLRQRLTTGEVQELWNHIHLLYFSRQRHGNSPRVTHGSDSSSSSPTQLDREISELGLDSDLSTRASGVEVFSSSSAPVNIISGDDRMQMALAAEMSWHPSLEDRQAWVQLIESSPEEAETCRGEARAWVTRLTTHVQCMWRGHRGRRLLVPGCTATHDDVDSVLRNSVLSESKVMVDQYIKAVIQNGFVAMFTALCPLLPVLAVLFNLLNIRADAYVFAVCYRRPEPVGATTIGMWQHILEVISVVAILTNCAVIYHVSGDLCWLQRSYDWFLPTRNTSLLTRAQLSLDSTALELVKTMAFTTTSVVSNRTHSTLRRNCYGHRLIRAQLSSACSSYLDASSNSGSTSLGSSDSTNFSASAAMQQACQATIKQSSFVNLDMTSDDSGTGNFRLLLIMTLSYAMLLAKIIAVFMAHPNAEWVRQYKQRRAHERERTAEEQLEAMENEGAASSADGGTLLTNMSFPQTALSNGSYGIPDPQSGTKRRRRQGKMKRMMASMARLSTKSKYRAEVEATPSRVSLKKGHDVLVAAGAAATAVPLRVGS